MKSHRNYSQRTHSIHRIGPKTHVLVRLVVFGCILVIFRYYTKLGAKWADLVQLMQKFVRRSRIGIFGNECSRSTPFDPKLMFWRVLCCLGAFEIVSSPDETRLKMGRTGTIKANVRATKWRRNFSKQTHLINPIGP